ncbi:MAG: hypothetical protein AAF851_21780 [Myxococcota bacterium]
MLRRGWPYVVVGFLFLATSPYFAGLNNPNEMSRLYAAKAFVDYGSFAVDPVIRHWGSTDDLAQREGLRYSSKAPWQSLVAIPAVAVAPGLSRALFGEVDKRLILHWTRYLATVFPSLIFALLLLRWCRRRSVELGASVEVGTGLGFALALGTMLYPYALTLTGHAWAAASVGGAYLGLIALGRRTPQEPSWRYVAMVVGCGCAIAPFAEYPAALAALPIVLGAVWMTRTWRRRAEVVAWMGLGGLPPLALGLWAHRQMWGHPLRTGYSSLANPAYADAHATGFFGVGAPKPDVLAKVLFSTDTGLFFFSPVLLVGLAMLLRSAFPRSTNRRHRLVARVGAVGVLALFVFIAAHAAWRGGWTLGPRYIIPVVPLLGLWVVEAMVVPAVRPWALVLGALSICMTGFAAALYPHLSDVYANPVAHFVLPTYARGLAPYGLGSFLGLEGGWANLLHVVPLAGVAAWTASRAPIEGGVRRLALCAVLFAAFGGLLVGVPERDASAAERETERLWRMWEPDGIAPPARPPPKPGRLQSLRSTLRKARVVNRPLNGEGEKKSCAPPHGGRCRYGDQPWQTLELTHNQVDGAPVQALRLHPVRERWVEMSVPVPAQAARLELDYALSDAAVTQSAPSPVMGELLLDGVSARRFQALKFPGWQRLELPLTGSSTITVRVTVQDDGAKVFLLDGWFYRN